MEITDRNFVTSLHESVTQSIDFHIQLTQNFVQELRLLGLILGASYKDCLQIPAFGMVASFFSEMYQFTFWFVLLHGIPTGRIDWLMRGVIERFRLLPRVNNEEKRTQLCPLISKLLS